MSEVVGKEVLADPFCRCCRLQYKHPLYGDRCEDCYAEAQQQVGLPGCSVLRRAFKSDGKRRYFHNEN